MAKKETPGVLLHWERLVERCFLDGSVGEIEPVDSVRNRPGSIGLGGRAADREAEDEPANCGING